MILLVDNYDSFTFNLMQYLSRFDEVHVLRNDDERLYDVAKKADGIVLSPGPGWPSDAGQMEDLIKDFAGQKPILGICLGHQAIAESFGGKLDLAKQVMHGKQSQMAIEKLSPIFTDVIKETAVMRYHSIVVSQLPEELDVHPRRHDGRRRSHHEALLPRGEEGRHPAAHRAGPQHEDVLVLQERIEDGSSSNPS